MKKILLVDDNRDQVRVLAALLADHGYEVVTAADGVEAQVGMTSDGRPDLILLDLLMPKLNGFAFLEHKNNQPDYRGIPVIVLSAWSDIYPMLPDDGVAVAAVINKNQPFRVLLAAIQQCLGQGPGGAA